MCPLYNFLTFSLSTNTIVRKKVLNNVLYFPELHEDASPPLKIPFSSPKVFWRLRDISGHPLAVPFHLPKISEMSQNMSWKLGTFGNMKGMLGCPQDDRGCLG